MAFGCQTFGMVKMPLRYFKGRRYFIVKDSYFKEDEGGSSSKHVKKSQSSRSTFTMKESVVKENKKTFLLSILVFRKNQSGYYIHIHVQRMIHTYTRTCTILQLLRHPNTHSTKTQRKIGSYLCCYNLLNLLSNLMGLLSKFLFLFVHCIAHLTMAMEFVNQ